MQRFKIELTKPALRDMRLLSPKKIEKPKQVLLNIIALQPYSGKKLNGDLEGQYSYRLNLKDRLVYRIDKEAKIVYIHRVRTHYGD